MEKALWRSFSVRFSLDSTWVQYQESKKVASLWSPAASTWLCCDGRVVSYCNADHRTEDLRDATPGHAADSLANAADLRKSGLMPGAASAGSIRRVLRCPKLLACRIVFLVVSAQPWGSSFSNEIGHLMQTHDDMIGRLQESINALTALTETHRRTIDSLREAHAELETRLNEQTSQLATQAARFDQLFDQIPEGIALLDADERVVRINGEFTRLFGYAPDEATGHFLNDLVLPEAGDDGASPETLRMHDTPDGCGHRPIPAAARRSSSSCR